MNKSISYIIPCFNEEKNIYIIYSKIKKVILKNKKFSFEIIFVNDYSEDNSLFEIKKIAKKDKNVKCISFTKNFGHQAAIKAGITHSSGNAVITLDCDLQHPPELTNDFIKIWSEKKYKIVHGIKRNYSTGIMKKIFSYLGYKLINVMTPNNKLDEGGSDFCLIDREIINTIKKNPKKNMIFRSYINSLGHKKFLLYFFPDKRLFGKSNYSFFQMFGIFKNSIIGYSIKPLRIISLIGFIILLISTVMILNEIIRFIINDIWPSGLLTILILQLFFGGFTIFCIGIIGEYIGFITEQLNGSPDYVIENRINFNKKD